MRGARAATYLIGGLIFGLLLEFFEVGGGSYTYGHFWLMLGHAPNTVPVWVGCGWGIILYTARLFSDEAGLPMVAGAACDALLALNVDLSMDVVAYRLHMWHWPWNGSGLNSLTAEWFGIPYENFIGWITVAFCYSLFSRMFERWVWKQSRLLWVRYSVITVLALLASLAVLMINETWVYGFGERFFRITAGRRLLLMTAILAMITVWGWLRGRVCAPVIEPLARWVPMWFHLEFVALFFVFGFYRENRWMTAAVGANIVIGGLIHFVYARRRSIEKIGRPDMAADRSTSM